MSARMTAKTLKKHKFGEWISRWYGESELQKYKGMDWFHLRNPSGVSGFGAGFGSTVRRSHGISSSALAQFVRSGKRPRSGDLPSDGYDFAACVRAMDAAPDFLENFSQKALYYLFRWVTSQARADGFKRGLAIGRKLEQKNFLKAKIGICPWCEVISVLRHKANDGKLYCGSTCVVQVHRKIKDRTL